MGTKRLLATLAVALAPLAAAPSAHADPAPVDNYLRFMHLMYQRHPDMPVISDDQLLRLGRAVCADLYGSNIPAVQESSTLMQVMGWTRIQANLLIGAAVPNLCPSPGVFY